MKEFLRSILILLVQAGTIPAAVYIGVSTAKPLMKFGRGVFKLGGRAGAPVIGAAQNLSGRVAHWGAGRGLLGRTVARVATGSISFGGRARMERLGETYRKAASERRIGRGAYRAQPSSSMNSDVLEKMPVEAIARWVNSDDPNVQKAVAALRQMVVDTPSIKLSTKQREALFSGGGQTPSGTPPPVFGAPSPVATPPPSGPGSLTGIDSAREGSLGIGGWLGSRPTVVPGVRQRGQSIGRWLRAHYVDRGASARSWAAWVAKLGPAAPPGSPPGTPRELGSRTGGATSAPLPGGGTPPAGRRYPRF